MSPPSRLAEQALHHAGEDPADDDGEFLDVDLSALSESGPDAEPPRQPKPVARRRSPVPARTDVRPPVTKPAQPAPAAGQVEHNGIVIDFTADKETITRAGLAMEVTARQAQLVAVLAKVMPALLGRDRLKISLFGDNPPGSADITLDGIASDLSRGLAGIGLKLTKVGTLGFALAEVS